MGIKETTEVLNKVVASPGVRFNTKVRDLAHCMKCDAVYELEDAFKKTFDYASIVCPECGVMG